MDYFVGFTIGFLFAAAIFWKPTLRERIRQLEADLRKAIDARNYWFSELQRRDKDDWGKE